MEIKVNKQKTNRGTVVKQSKMRQKSTKITLHLFCVGHLLLEIGFGVQYS